MLRATTKLRTWYSGYHGRRTCQIYPMILDKLPYPIEKQTGMSHHWKCEPKPPLLISVSAVFQTERCVRNVIFRPNHDQVKLGGPSFPRVWALQNHYPRVSMVGEGRLLEAIPRIGNGTIRPLESGWECHRSRMERSGCLSAILAAPRSSLDRTAWRSSDRKSDDLKHIWIRERDWYS